MRQVTRKGLITVAAAGGVLAISGGSAFADATADGGAANSPGVLSGNSVQAPVHAPVNACGNTVDAAALLNPAFGNTCVNDGGHGPAKSDGGHHGGGQQGPDGGTHQDGGHQGGGSTANSGAVNSPGVGSGNNVQVPIEVPVNACGNGIDVAGLLNPTFGNSCVNESGETPQEEPPNAPEEETPEPETPEEPKPEVPKEPNAPETQTVTQPELAQTGADYQIETALGMGASLLLGGSILYRRARAAQR
ncbi:hypothetical protein N566_00430 [Streptomycetaceae bacterium MP113-05]|nr:hypothetical protein N566_00430 [Streptomycetaceae bacterium MP113-05]